MNGPKHRSKLARQPTQPGAAGRHRLRLLAEIALIALASGAAVAGDNTIYTWKDANGNVHYGNRLPENQPAQPIELNARPVTVQPTSRIYTWTDADGKVHYGPQPPADTPARELKEDDSSLSTIPSSNLREGEKQLLRNIQKNQ